MYPLNQFLLRTSTPPPEWAKSKPSPYPRIDPEIQRESIPIYQEPKTVYDTPIASGPLADPWRESFPIAPQKKEIYTTYIGPKAQDWNPNNPENWIDESSGHQMNEIPDNQMSLDPDSIFKIREAMARYNAPRRPFSFDSELEGKRIEGLPLKEFVNHPELFRNYPELGEFPVRFNPNLDATASYIPNQAIEILDTRSGKHLSTGNLLHEIQHWIQDKEGWPSGGTISSDSTEEQKKNYSMLWGEAQARDTEARQYKSVKQRKDVAPFKLAGIIPSTLIKEYKKIKSPMAQFGSSIPSPIMGMKNGFVYRGVGESGAGVGVAHLGKGIYVSPEEGMAATFANYGGRKGTVLKFKVSPDAKILDIESPEYIKIKQKFGFLPHQTPQSLGFPKIQESINEEVRKLGYDGLDSGDHATGAVIFNEKKLIPVKDKPKSRSKNGPSK